MKKYLLLLSLLLAPLAIGAVGSNLDSVTVGTYLYPKTTGLPLGASTLKWASWLSSINGVDIADAILPAGSTTTQYLRGGDDPSWATLNTTAVTEGSNLYYTDARSRAALSAGASVTYNSSTGAIGCNLASGSSTGCLLSTDWAAFNSKQAGDADLTALSALSGTNTIYYRSASDTWSAVTVGSGLLFSGGSLTAPVMVGDSGSGGTAGLVPAPASGDSAKCLTGAGTWATCSGGGSSLNIATKTSDFTLTNSNDVILCSPAAGATVSILLHGASTATAKKYYVKNTSDAGECIVGVNVSTDLIEGESTLTLNPGGVPQSGNSFIPDGGSSWSIWE